MSSLTPQLDELLKMFIDDALYGMNVAMPAVVQTFDSGTCMCSVAPSLMRFYTGDTGPTPLPIINNVPVYFPCGGNFSMKWNLKKDDSVMLVISQRSLDVWKSSGGIVDPQDPRKFHLSDAVAFAGVRASNNPIAGDVSAGTIIQSGSAKMTLNDAGTFKFQNSSDELIDVLVQITTQLETIADKLSSTTTNTTLGPQTLLAAPDFATAKSAIDALKSKLTGLKG